MQEHRIDASGYEDLFGEEDNNLTEHEDIREAKTHQQAVAIRTSENVSEAVGESSNESEQVARWKEKCENFEKMLLGAAATISSKDEEIRALKDDLKDMSAKIENLTSQVADMFQYSVQEGRRD
jgi:DNA repair exonuclease SbcCD ATPase subunit